MPTSPSNQGAPVPSIDAPAGDDHVEVGAAWAAAGAEGCGGARRVQATTTERRRQRGARALLDGRDCAQSDPHAPCCARLAGPGLPGHRRRALCHRGRARRDPGQRRARAGRVPAAVGIVRGFLLLGGRRPGRSSLAQSTARLHRGARAAGGPDVLCRSSRSACCCSRSLPVLADRWPVLQMLAGPLRWARLAGGARRCWSGRGGSTGWSSMAWFARPRVSRSSPW